MTWQGLDPRAVGIVAGAAALVLGALYLLKPRRRRVQVPYSVLWTRVIDASRASSLWERLRRVASWLLFVCVTGLMALALGDPIVGASGCAGAAFEPAEARHTVVLVDVSASMQAEDATPLGALEGARPISRIERARQAVREILTQRRAGERILVASFSGRVRPLSTFEERKDVLERAVAAIVPTEGPTDLARALKFARSALGGLQRPGVIVVSDRAFSLGDVPAGDLEGLDARRYDVGPAPGTMGIDNLAVTSLALRPSLDDRLVYALTATVRNDSDRAVQAVLLLSASPDGASREDFADPRALFQTEALRLEARETRRVQLENLRFPGARVSARVETTAAERTRGFVDRFPVDDVAFAMVPERRNLRVLLVSEGNLFLEAALLVRENLTYQRVFPKAYDRRLVRTRAQDAEKGFDLVVLDGAPDGPPEGISALVFDGQGTAGLVDGTRQSPAPDLVVKNARHPVMSGIALSDLNLERARVLEPRKGDAVLASTQRGEPMLVARDEGARRLVVLGIDPTRSDIGGRFAMPLLVANAVGWLAREEINYVAPLTLGLDWAVSMPERVTRVALVEPDGRRSDASLVEGRALGSSETLGFMRFEADRAGLVEVRAARLPPEEQVLPGIGGEALAEWIAPDGASLASAVRPATELWARALIAVLALLGLEWVLYQRRVTA